VYSFSSKIVPSSLSARIKNNKIALSNLTWFDFLQMKNELLEAFQKQVKIERQLQHLKASGNRFLLLTEPGNRTR
jgi:hypothetical protein